jgi:hypothetical protein
MSKLQGPFCGHWVSTFWERRDGLRAVSRSLPAAAVHFADRETPRWGVSCTMKIARETGPLDRLYNLKQINLALQIRHPVDDDRDGQRDRLLNWRINQEPLAVARDAEIISISQNM